MPSRRVLPPSDNLPICVDIPRGEEKQSFERLPIPMPPPAISPIAQLLLRYAKKHQNN